MRQQVVGSRFSLLCHKAHISERQNFDCYISSCGKMVLAWSSLLYHMDIVQSFVNEALARNMSHVSLYLTVFSNVAELALLYDN